MAAHINCGNTRAIETASEPVATGPKHRLNPFFAPGFMYVMFAMVVARRLYGPLPQFIASDLGVPVALIAQTLTVETILSVAAALIVSPLADNLGRRPVILIAIAMRMAAAAAVWLIPDLSVLFLAAVFLGIGNGIVFPQIFSTVADLYDGPARDRFISWLLIISRFAFLAGPLISGFLAGSFGWPAAYAAGTLISAAALLLGWIILPRLPTRAGSLRALLAAMAASYRRLFADRMVTTLLSANVIFVIGGYGIEVFFGAFVAYSYGLSADQVGLVLTVGPAMAMISTWISGRIPVHLRLHSLVAAGLIFFIPVIVLLNLPLEPLFAIAMSAIWSFGLGLRSTSLNATVLDLAPEHRGAITGLLQVSFSSGIMLGSALGGAALTIGGYPLVGLFFGACALLSSIFFFFSKYVGR